MVKGYLRVRCEGLLLVVLGLAGLGIVDIPSNDTRKTCAVQLRSGRFDIPVAARPGRIAVRPPTIVILHVALFRHVFLLYWRCIELSRTTQCCSF